MKVIKPTTISDAMLISSGVAEPDAGETVWSAGTAYSVGQLAYRASNHRIYQRIVAGTTATAPESDTTNWKVYGSTNKWAMFDTEVSTQTIKTSPLTVVIDPGAINSLAMFGLIGSTVTISMSDTAGGTVVYSATIDLGLSSVYDWYTYFFEPFGQESGFVLMDLPPYTGCRLTVTVTGTGTVKCGALIVGNAYTLGGAQYGATAGIRDYSRKTTDETTGFVTLERRKFAKLMSAQIIVPTGSFNSISRLLQDLRSTPAVWIGDDTGDIEPLTVMGFYKDFRLNVAYPQHGYYTLEIEGMT